MTFLKSQAALPPIVPRVNLILSATLRSHTRGGGNCDEGANVRVEADGSMRDGGGEGTDVRSGVLSETNEMKRKNYARTYLDLFDAHSVLPTGLIDSRGALVRQSWKLVEEGREMTEQNDHSREVVVHDSVAIWEGLESGEKRPLSAMLIV